MIPDVRLLDAVLRNDFRAFTHKVFNTLSPGQDYVRNWHIDALAWELERVRLGLGTTSYRQHAAPVPQIHNRLGRLACIRAGARSDAAAYMRELLQ